MLRVRTALVHAFLLIRCIFSSEARQELGNYVQEAHWWELVASCFAALIGLALLGVLLVGLYNAFFIFYHLVTTGRAVP